MMKDLLTVDSGRMVMEPSVERSLAGVIRLELILGMPLGRMKELLLSLD